MANFAGTCTSDNKGLLLLLSEVSAEMLGCPAKLEVWLEV